MPAIVLSGKWCYSASPRLLVLRVAGLGLLIGPTSRPEGPTPWKQMILQVLSWCGVLTPRKPKEAGRSHHRQKSNRGGGMLLVRCVEPLLQVSSLRWCTGKEKRTRKPGDMEKDGRATRSTRFFSWCRGDGGCCGGSGDHLPFCSTRSLVTCLSILHGNVDGSTFGTCFEPWRLQFFSSFGFLGASFLSPLDHRVHHFPGHADDKSFTRPS